MNNDALSIGTIGFSRREKAKRKREVVKISASTSGIIKDDCVERARDGFDARGNAPI